MTSQEILSIKMQNNDAGAKTVRDYLKSIVEMVWEEGEGFSGKRPFGNSSWEYELFDALAIAGAIRSQITRDGDYTDVKHYASELNKARHLIADAIRAL